MSNKLFSHKVMSLFVTLTILLSMIFLAPVGNAKAEILCNPQIGVILHNTEIRVWCFQAGADVTLTVDDPATPQNPDYSDSGTVPAGDYPMLIFPYGTNLLLEPGFVIVASDGLTTRQLVFQTVGISEIDTQSNTVSGTAVPFSSVSVGAKLLSGDWVYRGGLSDSNGIWMVDFSDPNYYGGAVDLQNGVLIDATQYDGDYDGVTYEQMILPRIEVDPKEPYVMTYGWANGVSVTLEVDDPLTGQNPDCTLTHTAVWDMEGFYRPDCSIKAGDIVTVKGNNVSSSHEVRLLKITKVDVVNDSIHGVADKNQKLSLNMWMNGSEIKVETMSNADGDWEFNLSGLNPPVDLDVNDYSCQYIYATGANGNSTVAEFCLFPPNIFVDMSSNIIEIGDALLGDLITLTVDDPQTPTSPDFQTVLIGDDDPVVQPPFLIKPGFIVEMAGSVSMKQLIVMDLFITSVDVMNDRVYGYTDFPRQVWIDIYTPSPDWAFLGGRDVYPDENGNWMADFSGPYEWMKVDIQPGYEISVGQYDNDGDTLVNSWTVQSNLPPVADAGGPYTSFSGETITLDASGSSDPDGDPLTFEWDLDNDGQYDDATGVTADIALLDVGTFTVGVKVTDTGGLSDTDTADVTVNPVPISIDVKPGAYPNPINFGSKGIVPVAVLTTDEFDASSLDPATVIFAGASPLRWVLQDVDLDGDMDLLFHFNTQELGLDESSANAVLTGETFDGIFVEGVDSVKIVPNK